jgi:hypothetical protein
MAILSRLVGAREWRLERVIEAGEEVALYELFQLGITVLAPQEWSILEETSRVDHA